MIKIPVKLETELKRQAIAVFDNNCKKMSIDHFEFIKEKLPRVVKRLTRNEDDWVFTLGNAAESLVRNVDFVKGGEFTDHGRIAAAALYYLCDPNDVIPDYHPSHGYVDDAAVMNEALRRLKKASPSVFNSIQGDIS